MNPLRLVAAAIVTVAGVMLLSFASAAPVPYHAPDSARLRLSWSARPERIETCRELSVEEQARLAEHMRQRVACQGAFATYSLRVEVDGRIIDETVIRGAGLRNDRPLFLLRDFVVPPGTHRFRIALTRREKTDDDAAAFARAVVPDVDTGLYAGRAQREASEHSRRARAAIPASLVLDSMFYLAPQRVALVTFNTQRRLLELRPELTER